MRVFGYLFEWQTIPNFIGFVVRQIRRLFHKDELLADPTIIKYRLYRCYDCWKYDKQSTQCEECTCFVGTKTRFSSESCPIGRWKKV